MSYWIKLYHNAVMIKNYVLLGEILLSRLLRGRDGLGVEDERDGLRCFLTSNVKTQWPNMLDKIVNVQ